MATAVERIVVQATAEDKEAIVAKATQLGLPISELMRRGAFAYRSGESETELAKLAESAKLAADRAGRAIDDALAFIEASNRRITAMEARAGRLAKARARPTRPSARKTA
jgi:hypothetical protein